MTETLTNMGSSMKKAPEKFKEPGGSLGPSAPEPFGLFGFDFDG